MKTEEQELHEAMVMAEMLSQARAELCEVIRRRGDRAGVQRLMAEIERRSAANTAFLAARARTDEDRLAAARERLAAESVKESYRRAPYFRRLESDYFNAKRGQTLFVPGVRVQCGAVAA